MPDKNFTIQKCQNSVGEWETFDEDGCPIETFDTYEDLFAWLLDHMEEEAFNSLTLFIR